MSLEFRSRLRRQIGAYVELKTALGRRFYWQGRVLAHLDRFLVVRRHAKITPDVFADWCLSYAQASPTWRRKRMLVVRGFCLHLRRGDARAFVPDIGEFPAPDEPRRPYIFAAEQIATLLRAASKLSAVKKSPLRAEVYRLALVLLYTAGLRLGELARLVMSDYDSVERTLRIRASKFHKSRLVALSKSAADEMERYLRARRRLPHAATAPLLVSFDGRGYESESLGMGLHKLFRRGGVRSPEGLVPRVHDLRHTFAVHALLRWYRDGVDVQAKLPALSTAMGHVDISSTAYYLGFVTPLADEASDRFARHSRTILATTRARS
jgi:integrase